MTGNEASILKLIK